jgi:hypothetical protein
MKFARASTIPWTVSLIVFNYLSALFKYTPKSVMVFFTYAPLAVLASSKLSWGNTVLYSYKMSNGFWFEIVV